MNPKQLIDKFGELSEQIRELDEKRKKIRKELEKLEVGTHFGDKYQITIVEVESPEYDIEKVARRLKKDTLKVVKVVPAELKKYIPEIELPRYVSKVSSRRKITPKRRK